MLLRTIIVQLTRELSELWLSVMNGYLLLLASLTHCISSETALEDQVLLDSISDSINRHLYLDFYPDVIKKIRHLLDSRLEDFPINCSLKLLQFWRDLDKDKRAAYLDSFGKVGAGILTGNVRYLGYYDQCIDIGNTDYCRFPFDMILTKNTRTGSSPPVTIRVPFEFGMCFPSSCDSKEFYDLFFIGSDEVFHSKSFTDINAELTHTVNVMAPIEYKEPLCPWRDLEWTNSSIIVLTVCVLLIVLVITGTMVDMSFWFINDILPKLHLPENEPPETMTYPTSCEVKHSINEDEPLINGKLNLKGRQIVAEKRCIEFVKDLILSFSLYKTVPLIMATRHPANAITSVNGMRVMSLFWVILGHTFVWEIAYGVIANIKEVAEKIPKRFLFQPVDNAFFAVDTFFVLSGALVSYLSIREMESRQGKFPLILFYLHRLLRLSPTYYLTVFLYFKVLPYVGSGPLWFFTDFSRCEKYWWTNLLYINNFYPVSLVDQCYLVTWYLANDMQFFIISPIFLLLLYRFWKIGLATIAGTMLASIAVIGTLAGIKNVNANLVQDALTSTYASSNIYEKPYCRINAYLIGIVLGFVLYRKWRVRSNLWFRICFYSVLWMIAAACCLTIVFGQYKTWNGHPFSKAENVMYFMFSRTVYSIGIALMIYACHNGFGGVINKFLSWSFWIPLSRLTFTAYLSHPVVLTLMYSTMRFRFIYTDWLLILLFAAAVVLSYSLALILAVTVEYPLSNVENAVYKFIGMKRRK